MVRGFLRESQTPDVRGVNSGRHSEESLLIVISAHCEPCGHVGFTIQVEYSAEEPPNCPSTTVIGKRPASKAVIVTHAVHILLHSGFAPRYFFQVLDLVKSSLTGISSRMSGDRTGALAATQQVSHCETRYRSLLVTYSVHSERRSKIVNQRYKQSQHAILEALLRKANLC